MLNHQWADLPAHLSERICVHAEGTNENGHFVLYWMQTVVRADENPALEVAIRIADQQRLPILVYQAISQDYDYASVDTQGGSNAGYARWNRFIQTALGRYAARRNNALVDGVSRMSAYLQYKVKPDA